MTKKVLWCVAVMTWSSMNVALAEDKVTVGLTADLFSKYVWRGQDIVDNWVLQPSAGIGYRGFTGTIWGNMDLTGEVVGEGQFNEIDLSLDYSNKFPGQDLLGYSVGVIHYDFVNTHFAATDEVYGALTTSVPLSPALRWYYDFDEIKGSYIQLSVGRTIEKLQQWRDDCYCSVQVGASVAYGTAGYNEGYFGVDEGAFNDLTLSAGLPFCLGRWTIKPSIAYSTMLDDDIRTATRKSDNLWGGLSASVSF